MLSPHIHGILDSNFEGQRRLATAISWAEGVGETGKAGQVIASGEVPSWLISHSSVFRIAACSTGSFQPRATNLIYNVLNCLSFSSSLADRWACTIRNALSCACKNDNRANTTFQAPNLCKESLINSIYSFFIYTFSSDWCSEKFLLRFVWFFLYGILNFFFNCHEEQLLWTS